MAELLALTIKQPWQWGVSKGIKPVENRTWTPHPGVVGRYLALHAGKELDELAGVDAFTNIVRVPGMAERLAAVHGDRELTLRMMPLGCITAVGRLARIVTSAEELEEWARPWFCGPFGWVFDQVQELTEPVPCRGMQKLWTVPADVAELVRARWKDARRPRPLAPDVTPAPPPQLVPEQNVCRSCGAPVIWCLTTKGTRMPVDVATAPEGNIVLEGPQAVGVPPLAKYVGARKGRHLSHFATCPNAAKHRRKA